MKICNFRNILETGDYLNISKKLLEIETGMGMVIYLVNQGLAHELIYSAENGGRQ